MTIDDIRKKLKQQQDYRASKVAEYRATLPQQQTSTWNAVQNRLLNQNQTKLQQERLKQSKTNILPKNQSTQPITQARTDLKEEKQTKPIDNVLYGAKKLGAGVLSGVTGIVSSGITDIASQLKKGEEKSTSQAVSDLTKKMLLPQPMNILNNATETIKENIGTLTDSNKNVWQKVAGIAQNSVSDATNVLPFKDKTNAVIQTIGNFLKNKKSSDAVLDVNKFISQPSESVNQALAQEGQQYGKATQFVGDALQSVGNMLPSIGVSMVTGDTTGATSLFTMGLGAKGNATTEALNKGVELEDAVKRGDTDAMIEVGTEMLTGGVNIFGKGALDDLIQKGVVDRVKNNVAKFFVQQGVNIGGEILEETISDVLGTVLDKGTVDPDASYSLDDWNKTAVTTMLSTLILNTLTGGLVGDIRQVQNDNLIDKSNLTDEQKENLRNFAEENNLNREQIERAIEITNTEQNQDTTTQNEPVLNQEQQITQGEQKQAQNEISQEIRQDEELTEKAGQIVTNLMRSIDNYNNTRQEGEKVFDINNEDTRKEIESIQKIAQDRGINITFDESRFDNTDTNAFYEYDEKGNVANIVLNPNSTSKKYVQNLVIHEMTHSFEGSKQYDSLSKAILDYAKSKGEYKNAFDDLMKTYSKVYSGENLNKIVEKEAVANILGEKLGDKQFVESLVNNQYVERSTIQKIIDFVKNQINRFKGYKDQEQYWNNIKNLYEEAYNKSEVSKEGLKQSVETNKDKIQKHKEEQLEIVKETNPMWDEEHVGIRKVEDIKTFEECVEDAEEDGSFVWGDYTEEDAKRDLARGKVTIYSSYPIKNGVFVSTSYQQAYEYAGHDASKVHQRTVNLDSVAWINGDEGQYAKVKPKVDENKAYQKMIDDVANSLRVTNKTNELDIYGKARQLASNEFKKLTTDEEYDNYNKRIEEIEKDLTKRLLQEEASTKDSQGRTLSKQQQEYFKDSKVRDENGNLLEVYHGTNNEFTEFDSKKFGKYTGKLKGIWLTDKIINANAYGNNIIQSYANIQNPGSATEVTMNKEQYTELLKNVDVKDTNINSSWEHFKSENDFDILTHIQRLYENKGKTLQEFYNDVINITGIDGIYDEKYLADGSPIWIAFNSNQIKKISNENPTTNPDIRYSQDTTGAWNNFIEKYFKNEGEGTSIQDLKKLPERKYTMQDFESVLDNSKNIPVEDKKALKSDLESIELNKKSLDEFTKLVKDLDKNYFEYNESQIGKKLTKQETSQLYRTYQNKPTTYRKSSMKTALDSIQGNRYGRTKSEWLQVAELAGVENANLTPQELDKIANESWFDLAPNTKSQLNRQGQGYVEFTLDDWRDAFYKGVKENRQYSIDTENAPQLPKAEQVGLPKAKKILNPTEISNLTLEDVNTTPKLPTRNYEKGTKVSNFVSNIENDVGFLTENQKKELLKDENVTYYAPVTNADTLEKAYKNLTENGKNATMNWYAKNSENATAEDVATGWILLKQYADNGDTQGMVNVAKKLRDMGTKAGQTVQAFNILSRLTPEGMVAYTQGELQDAYNEMIKGKSKKWIDEHKADFDLSQDEIAFIMDTMQNLPAENPADNNYDRKVALGQIQKLFTDKLPSEGNAIKSWMRISMLFNPKTQVRNVAGNAIVVPVNMFSDFLGSKVDKALSKYSGVRTLGTVNKGYLKGMKEGFYQSYNDFKLGINTRDIEQNKFEFGQGKAFKDKGIGKALNRVDNLLNFVMDFGDRGFSQASFVNSLNNQMLLNGVTTPTQEMIDIATNEALSRTWNDDNDYTRFVLNIRKGLNKIGGKNYGLGDVLIPFAKTPANLTKAIVEYSPVGLTKSILDIPNIKNAIETGQFTAQQQHQFADHLGKGLAGTMLYILSYALASAGIATGESDEDKDVKNFLKNSLGIGAYSIKIGDKSFAYDWAQPIATPLAIMTNLYQTNKNNPDASLLDKTLSAVNIGTNQLLEQSFMESLNEVLNGNGEITERLQKAVLDLPARAIPTFSKQIADMVDSTQRTSFEYGKPLPSAINAVKAKLPGISKTLTPVVDTLGNEVQKFGGENNFFNVFFNPANMNKGEKTKAGEEIYNVYEQTGDTSIFPVTAPYYVNYNGEKITMDSTQRAEYQRTSGTYTEEAINDLLNDKDYQKLDDEDKAEILSKVVTDSNEKAKRDVLGIENKNSDLQLIDEVGSDYYTYKLATKGMTKDAEQCSTLLNKNYSNENKKLIYESEINKEDKTFNGLQTISKTFNMDNYLKYKAQTFSGDKKKENTYNYVENSGFNRLEQLYILGRTYKLSVADRAEFERLLNQTALTPKQKREVYLTLNGVEEKDDGSIGWK